MLFCALVFKTCRHRIGLQRSLMYNLVTAYVVSVWNPASTDFSWHSYKETFACRCVVDANLNCSTSVFASS